MVSHEQVTSVARANGQDQVTRTEGMKKKARYQAPRVVVAGTAVQLVQGYLYGAYSDGYTNYNWNR